MYAQRDPTVVLRMTADSVDFSFLHIKLTSTSDTDKFVADKSCNWQQAQSDLDKWIAYISDLCVYSSSI